MKYFFTAVIFILTITTKAEQNIETRFRSAGTLALHEAQARGVESIDGLNLKDIEKSILSVRIISKPGLNLNFENRRCAIWQNAKELGVKEAPHIYLNETCKSLTDIQLKGIALHEFLGVTFGLDRNYEISARLMSATSFTNLQVALRSGGSTGVGGGGDYDDLKFKIYGLRRLEVLKKENSASYSGFKFEKLAENLLLMKISPASDIEKLIEYRGPGVEQAASKTYIQSSTYRADDEQVLGRLALLSSVLEARFGKGQSTQNDLKLINPELIKVRLK